MEINEEILKGKWREIKGEIQKVWGKIKDDELEQTKGDLSSIAGLVQQKYGEGKSEFREKLSRLMERFGDKREETSREIKENLKEL